MTTTDLTIRPFQPGDQVAAKALILAGLEGHWGTLDPTLNPDLNDIAASYSAGMFLTAWLGDRLVGTGAYIPHGEDTIEIVRMSVDSSLRRIGIGRQILTALVDSARTHGYHRVILETTTTWEDAIGFYRSYGFQFTHYRDGDSYFTLDL